jgi:hypothetical protein
VGDAAVGDSGIGSNTSNVRRVRAARAVGRHRRARPCRRRSAVRDRRGSMHRVTPSRHRVHTPWRRACRSCAVHHDGRRHHLDCCRLLRGRRGGRRRRWCRWWRRRLRRRPRRQQRHRVDVPVRISRVADAQVNVRLRPLGVAARPDRSDHVSLHDGRPDGDADRAEVDERDRPAIRGPHRQAQPLARHSSCERHGAARGRTHVGTGRSADVDAAVLSARVRVVPGDERPQHGTVGGPRPRRGARHQHERGKQDDEECVA